MKYLQNYTVKGKTYHELDQIFVDDLYRFEQAGIETVDIKYDEIVYSLLSTLYPVEYRIPYAWADFITFDRKLETLERVSTLTKRKRYLICVGDIYSYDQHTGKRVTIFRHNDAIDYKRWNQVKRLLDKNKRIYYRNSENGIIIFVNLQPHAESSYIERFKKNTDLVSAIVARKKDCKIEISPDFIPTEDVYTINDPKDLLKFYQQSNARLIIIGETLNDDYRKALLQVKEYDKFARMMVVPNLDLRNIDHFLLQVKMVYNADRWTE
ncbi:MAG: hypothetical protein N3F66_05120 [Spirochaetes bacterium]|nr:hypothetical protein [Spirochaetota bacterium]